MCRLPGGAEGISNRDALVDVFGNGPDAREPYEFVTRRGWLREQGRAKSI